MLLDKFYSLRKDFILIGLTGRAGGGCSELSRKLANKNFIKDLNYEPNETTVIAEEIKFNLCYDYLNYEGNWEPFQIIEYKHVLLLHLVFESIESNNIEKYLYKTLTCNGNQSHFINRFNSDEDDDFLKAFCKWFSNEICLNHKMYFENGKGLSMHKWLKKNIKKEIGVYFFKGFNQFAVQFYKKLNNENCTKRSRFCHDISFCLREYGKCLSSESDKKSIEFIYTVAESINRLVKSFRESNRGKSRVVIDSLKNSLELMYFKEKYGGFYMLAINKNEEERKKYVRGLINNNHAEELLNLDIDEAKGDDVNDGKFASPDIENCIQKSDYHIFHGEDYRLTSELEHRQKNLNYQVVKLLALISQPGIITPTPLERTMQVAYNAKYNSGCISRQVGAVVTDKDYIVKSIGWNDVAKNQMPCKLRKLDDLVCNKRTDIFSDYEKNGSANNSITKEEINFKQKAKSLYEASKTENLNGRHCAFCFKSLQNSMEGEKNQVHTRSLHAEENAMMQIAKKGGNGLEHGKLFTTASPCELCSKKAFQLGVEEIYYIDPYPGIARQHTLKNGIKIDDHDPNPKMIMFRGAVGRAYHKLYEPFMSYKDEVKILTGYAPKIESNVLKAQEVQALMKDKNLLEQVKQLINNKKNL